MDNDSRGSSDTNGERSLTEEELEEIVGRVEDLRSPANPRMAIAVARLDLEKLIAEVRRLRAGAGCPPGCVIHRHGQTGV